MSWGKGILFLYLGFVIMIIAMVWISMNQKVDLVASDYYDQELKFENKITASKNVNQLTHPVEVIVKENEIEINYPVEVLNTDLSGSIIFYRSSDKEKDIISKVNPDQNGKQIFSKANFSRGIYLLKLDFNTGGKEYYLEKTLTL